MASREAEYPLVRITVLLPSRQEDGVLDVIRHLEQIPQVTQIVISNDRHSRGKGWALREALEYADGDVIVFLDADGDIHPRMINRLIPFLDDYEVVIGRKQVRGLLSRRILTRISRLYIWALFGLIYDTQTGLKMFKRKTLKPWVSDSFAFDIEVLSSLHDSGYQIIEVPVEVEASKRMNIKSIWRCLWESVKIYKERLKRRGLPNEL